MTDHLDEVSDYELGRVFFTVSSKEGSATLGVSHAAARQHLLLPVHPRSAVEVALPLLTHCARVYAAQWSTIAEGLVLEDRDAAMLSLPAAYLPEGIAEPAQQAALTNLFYDFMDPDWLGWFPRDSFNALGLDYEPNLSNNHDFTHEPEFWPTITHCSCASPTG